MARKRGRKHRGGGGGGGFGEGGGSGVGGGHELRTITVFDFGPVGRPLGTGGPSSKRAPPERCIFFVSNIPVEMTWKEVDLGEEEKNALLAMPPAMVSTNDGGVSGHSNMKSEDVDNDDEDKNHGATTVGTFNMKDFKEVFKSKDFTVSIPYFWQKFDTQNYSIWKFNYKYNDKLTRVFMSGNLIDEFCHRLDKLRKNAFASMCLFGENNNSTISGIGIWRDKDVAELDKDWMSDFQIVELKVEDPETKNLVEQYLKWEGKDEEGRAFNQGKIFM